MVVKRPDPKAKPKHEDDKITLDEAKKEFVENYGSFNKAKFREVYQIKPSKPCRRVRKEKKSRY